ncbi:hypothetical protein Pst134EB_003769 [Puccinia striiformis f. sp. tritici]|nr:hypothetical protein Pst134EB_003769 [Puccinia striiformis f. sp. tritici]
MVALNARRFRTLLCTTIALAVFPRIQCKRNQVVTSYPSRFIVTLNPDITPTLNDFEAHLSDLKISYRILEDYTTLVPDVFYGVSLYLERSEDAYLIQNSTRVERLNVVKEVFPLQTFKTRIDVPHLASAENYPPHVQTNITDLHRIGVLGQGVKVAIIDSGVDCAHPALGGGFGPGKRISFGLDLVGDKFNGTNDPVRGGDPCTKCGLHGTHVAGIVAAQDVGYGFTGVAPKAQLGMYIFGCGQESQTRDDIILAALLTAYKDGADVINLSLGGSAGWGKGAVLYDVINTLVEKKSAIIVASAGNEGAEGLFMATNPASSKNAIAVGSVDAASSMVHYFRTPTGHKIPYRSAVPFPSGNFPAYFTSNSTDVQDDACKPLPESTPDLSKYVVIIRRGTCYFETKVEQAQAKGAKFVLFYWNSTEPVGLPNRLANATVAVMTAQDGKYLFKASRRNKDITLDFTHSPSFYAPSQNGGFMSNFSQYGPSYDFLSPQPAISGVGGDVVSTWPLDQGGYAASSGTSMAAPQIAGVAALILSARGKNFNGLTIRSRLASTARLIRTDYGNGVLESAIHQGGGLVNAFCAVLSNTSVSTSSIVLNDSANRQCSQTFTLTNEGSRPVTYHLRHLPAGSIAAFAVTSKHGRIDSSIRTSSANYASVDIRPKSFVVRPGHKQVIRTKFVPPAGLSSEDLHVYSGYISLVSDSPCESHTVPYYGVIGSMKDQKIIDRGPNVDIDKSSNSRYHYPHFVFSDNNRSSTAAKPLLWNLKKHDHTTLLFRANFGSPYMRVDLVPHDAALSNYTNSTNSAWKTKFRGINLLGLIPTSDSEMFSRSGQHEVQELEWNATIVDNEFSKPKRIPDGKYKVLLRALRVTGDLENEADFDTWLSPIIYLRN